MSVTKQTNYNVQEADRPAQQVLSVSGQILAANDGTKLSPEYERVHDKAWNYRQIRRTADNRRRHSVLDPELETEEKESMRIFMKELRASGLLGRVTSR